MKQIAFRLITTALIAASALCLFGACDPTRISVEPDASSNETPVETPNDSFTETTVTLQITPVPTAEPTDEPTPEPTPVPTLAPVSDEDLENGALDAFFADSFMIGDSLTGGLSLYVESRREKGETCLGEMKFVFVSAYFLEKAYVIEIGERAPELKYRGKAYTTSDLVAQTGAKTIYLMLGTEDIYHNTPEDNLLFYDQIISNILEKSPDVHLVLFTIPPVLKSYAHKLEYDLEINYAVNDALRTYCEEHGITLLELADLVRGDDGFLNPSLCSDKRFHFNKKGRDIWISVLREYARSQYESEVWTLPDTEN